MTSASLFFKLQKEDLKRMFLFFANLMRIILLKI